MRTTTYSNHQLLPETARDFLSRRLLDADIPREEFVATGVAYLERVSGGPDSGGSCPRS